MGSKATLRESLLEADVDTEGNEGPIDSVIITDTHRSLCIQTDLTMLDLHGMEHDNHKLMEELQVLQIINSVYPRKEQLESKLTQHVMLPTRHQANQESSLLDLIITNDPNFMII